MSAQHRRAARVPRAEQRARRHGLEAIETEPVDSNAAKLAEMTSTPSETTSETTSEPLPADLRADARAALDAARKQSNNAVLDEAQAQRAGRSGEALDAVNLAIEESLTTTEAAELARRAPRPVRATPPDAPPPPAPAPSPSADRQVEPETCPQPEVEAPPVSRMEVTDGDRGRVHTEFDAHARWEGLRGDRGAYLLASLAEDAAAGLGGGAEQFAAGLVGNGIHQVLPKAVPILGGACSAITLLDQVNALAEAGERWQHDNDTGKLDDAADLCDLLTATLSLTGNLANVVSGAAWAVVAAAPIAAAAAIAAPCFAPVALGLGSIAPGALTTGEVAGAGAITAIGAANALSVAGPTLRAAEIALSDADPASLLDEDEALHQAAQAAIANVSSAGMQVAADRLTAPVAGPERPAIAPEDAPTVIDEDRLSMLGRARPNERTESPPAPSTELGALGDVLPPAVHHMMSGREEDPAECPVHADRSAVELPAPPCAEADALADDAEVRQLEQAERAAADAAHAEAAASWWANSECSALTPVYGRLSETCDVNERAASRREAAEATIAAEAERIEDAGTCSLDAAGDAAAALAPVATGARQIARVCAMVPENPLFDLSEVSAQTASFAETLSDVAAEHTAGVGGVASATQAVSEREAALTTVADAQARTGADLDTWTGALASSIEAREATAARAAQAEQAARDRRDALANELAAARAQRDDRWGALLIWAHRHHDLRRAAAQS